MNVFKRVLMGLVLGLGLVALVQGPALATCAQWWHDPIAGTDTCIIYTPDLLPGARWCSGSPAPGSREITIFMEPNYNNSSGFCQVVPVPGAPGLQVSNAGSLSYPGLYGYYYIKSLWLGSNVWGNFYQNTGYSGTSHQLGTPVGQLYYENDINAHWGYNPRSFSVH